MYLINPLDRSTDRDTNSSELEKICFGLTSNYNSIESIDLEPEVGRLIEIAAGARASSLRDRD